MGTCKTCKIAISGRGRQRCEPCAVVRKQETNAAFWDRVAAAKPFGICERCEVPFLARCGRQSLRHLCQPCALEQRRINVLAYDRVRWYARPPRDPLQARAYTQRYKRDHPEWNRVRSAMYKRNHPDKVREQVNRRRAKWHGAPGRVTVSEFWKKCDTLLWTCHYCGCVLDRTTATMDHVVPLSKGGTNFLDNILPACRSCNSKKGARLHYVGKRQKLAGCHL